MGFCLFNSIAVAAALARAELGVERVLVLDWDVHHGNGTEAIFRDRDDVLLITIQQDGIWPGPATRAWSARARARASRSTCRCRKGPGARSSSRCWRRWWRRSRPSSRRA